MNNDNIKLFLTQSYRMTSEDFEHIAQMIWTAFMELFCVLCVTPGHYMLSLCGKSSVKILQSTFCVSLLYLLGRHKGDLSDEC